jgi:hypothetical protein
MRGKEMSELIEEMREPKSLFDVIMDDEDSMHLDEIRAAISLFDTGMETEFTEVRAPHLPQRMAEEQRGFWRRQFQSEPTTVQRVFDWAFGVALPVICFVADPIVFKNWGGRGDGFLSNYAPFAYVLSSVSVISMIVWLTFGQRLRLANAAFSGLFAVGAIISLIIGLVLFPFSLLGLIVLIGALGFTPLITSIIYLRNSYRAFSMVEATEPKRLIVHAFLLSALFSVVVPYAINVQIGSWKSPVKFIREIYYGRGL